MDNALPTTRPHGAAAPHDPAQDEKLASARLATAKWLLSRGDTAAATVNLQKLLASFPNSQAASEAKELLAKMKL